MKVPAGSGRKSMSILATIEYLSNKAASVERLAIEAPLNWSMKGGMITGLTVSDHVVLGGLQRFSSQVS